MARGKVRPELIANLSARKTTFKKRRRGLKKKVQEISILCGIEVCSVVFGPDDSQPPDVWPSVAGAQQIIERFRQLPERDQMRKMTNEVEFTRRRIDKAAERLKKIQAENKDKMLREVIDRFLLTGNGVDGLSLPDLTRISEILSEDFKWLNKALPLTAASSSQPPIPPPPPATVVPRMPGNHPPPSFGTAMAYGGPSTHRLPAPTAVAGPRLVPSTFGLGMGYGGLNNQWYAVPPPLPTASTMAVPGMMPMNFPPSFGLGMDYSGPNNQLYWNAALPPPSLPAIGAVPPRMMPGMHPPSFGMMSGYQPPSFGLGMDYGGTNSQWHGPPVLHPSFGLGMPNQPPVRPMLADMAVSGNQPPSFGINGAEYGGPSTQDPNTNFGYGSDDTNWSSIFFPDPNTKFAKFTVLGCLHYRLPLLGHPAMAFRK